MLVVGYQRKWIGPLWQGGVSTSVINYRKSYFEMSSRHVVAKKKKPALCVRLHQEAVHCQTNSWFDRG